MIRFVFQEKMEQGQEPRSQGAKEPGELFGIMASSLEERHGRTRILAGIGREMALERFRIIQPHLEHDRSL
jgi:hypothetical protein